MTYHTKAGAYLAERLGDWRPRIAIVLGSGLGDVTRKMHVMDTIPYAEIPDFFAGTVVGHDKQLVCGEWQGQKVVALQGRAHFYEGASVEAVQLMVRAMRDIGCEMWLATNAVGSLDPAIRPGHLVLIATTLIFKASIPWLVPMTMRARASVTCVRCQRPPAVAGHCQATEYCTGRRRLHCGAGSQLRNRGRNSRIPYMGCRRGWDEYGARGDSGASLQQLRLFQQSPIWPRVI